MIPRIRAVKSLPDFKLLISFDTGETKLYDVGDDIKSIKQFHDLKTVPGLFDSFRIDSSRTCVYWNDTIDLPSDTLYEYGVKR